MAKKRLAIRLRSMRPWYDNRFDFSQREKLVMPEDGDDPALRHLHAQLDFGLIARLAHPRRARKTKHRN